MKKATLLLAATALMASLANAATIIEASNTATFNNDTVGNITPRTAVGFGGATGTNRNDSYIFFDLTSAASELASANVDFQLAFNMDTNLAGPTTSLTVNIEFLGTLDSDALNGATDGPISALPALGTLSSFTASSNAGVQNSGTLSVVSSSLTEQYALFRFTGATSPGAASQWEFNNPDFALTVVPEPSSYALIAGALALTSIMVRRRRS